MSEISITVPMLVELCKQEQIRELPKDFSYKSGYREAFKIMQNLLSRVKIDDDLCNNSSTEDLFLRKLKRTAETNNQLVEFMNESCLWLDKVKTTLEFLIHDCNTVLAEIESKNSSAINTGWYLDQIKYQNTLETYLDKLKSIFEPNKE